MYKEINIGPFIHIQLINDECEIGFEVWMFEDKVHIGIAYWKV